MKIFSKSSQGCSPSTKVGNMLREYQRPTITARRIASIVHKLSEGPIKDNDTGGRATFSGGGGLGTSGG